MSKLIKLSDTVGETLAQRAAEANLSMAGGVANLLSVSELPPSPVDTSYFDRKFDELKSLIEDTTVDRVAGGVGPQSSHEKTYIDWPIMQDVFFDFLEPHAPEWASSAAEEIISNMDNPLECYIQDGQICADDSYGHKSVILNLSTRLREFLTSKGAVL